MTELKNIIEAVGNYCPWGAEFLEEFSPHIKKVAARPFLEDAYIVHFEVHWGGIPVRFQLHFHRGSNGAFLHCPALDMTHYVWNGDVAVKHMRAMCREWMGVLRKELELMQRLSLVD